MYTFNLSLKNKVLLLQKSKITSSCNQPYAPDSQVGLQLSRLDPWGCFYIHLPTWQDHFNVSKASHPQQWSPSMMPLSAIHTGDLESHLFLSLTFQLSHASSMWPVIPTSSLHSNSTSFAAWIIADLPAGLLHLLLSSSHCHQGWFSKTHTYLKSCACGTRGTQTCVENFIISTWPQNGSLKYTRIPYQWCLAFFHWKCLLNGLF